jgi:hypothetical protein
MQVKALLTLLASGLAALAGAAPAAAQFFERPQYQYYQPQPQPQPRGYYEPAPRGYYQPAPGGGYYYYPAQPRRRAQPAPQPQPQAQPSPLRRLFGLEDDAPREVVQPRQQPRPRPAPTVARVEKPKVEPSTYVMVFGDAWAELAGQGLTEVFDDVPEVDVSRKTRGDGGLVRIDASDWPKIIEEAAGKVQKPTIAVVMMGANDRQPIREGETSHEVLSERWRQVYTERVDSVVRAFRDRNIPLVWIGAPPAKNEKASADLIAMNEIYRDRVERAGGTYVDIWPGFVDDDNRYTASGPNIAGDVVRLRNNDGVNFTRAGGRKVAHFADTALKKIMEAQKAGTAVAAVPANPAVPGSPATPAQGAPPVAPAPGAPAVGAPGTPPAPAEAAVAAVPPPAPAVPEKPVAGPVVPLTQPAVASGGTLITSVPRLDNATASTAQKALRDGVAPAPRPGRADDFRWPRT